MQKLHQVWKRSEMFKLAASNGDICSVGEGGDIYVRLNGQWVYWPDFYAWVESQIAALQSKVNKFIVSSLPDPGSYPEGAALLNMADGKLYVRRTESGNPVWQAIT